MINIPEYTGYFNRLREHFRACKEAAHLLGEHHKDWRCLAGDFEGYEDACVEIMTSLVTTQGWDPSKLDDLKTLISKEACTAIQGVWLPRETEQGVREAARYLQALFTNLYY